ncbi:iron donor protein CyaY [Thioalkalivibrio sp. ALJ16]|uniref:iron donor protein CyaY n=1 Tax=Thioalkalivibrio sp. ALJ16 TaxID=1158762 RepID=UPI00037983D8|nr:iron donor protein CyaY [Thioalkalivibrio sp. ALJ16]
MSQTSFAVFAEQTLDDIQTRLSDQSALDDLDIDLIDGVMTIEFEDGAQMILNRQEAAQQIWLSSPEGPAHFGYSEDEGAWIDDRNGDDLHATLVRVIEQKLGVPVEL